MKELGYDFEPEKKGVVIFAFSIGDIEGITSCIINCNEFLAFTLPDMMITQGKANSLHHFFDDSFEQFSIFKIEPNGLRIMTDKDITSINNESGIYTLSIDAGNLKLKIHFFAGDSYTECVQKLLSSYNQLLENS